MANKVTEGTTLNVGLEYTGEGGTTKTAYLKLPNPREDLTESEIKTAVLKSISGNNAILKDAMGAMFNSETAIATAYTEYEKKTEIDIGVN